MKITQCSGEGQGSCKRCSDKGKWNLSWMCFLYKIEGRPGCYCGECVKELAAEEARDEIWAMTEEESKDEKWVNIAKELESEGLL